MPTVWTTTQAARYASTPLNIQILDGITPGSRRSHIGSLVSPITQTGSIVSLTGGSTTKTGRKGALLLGERIIDHDGYTPLTVQGQVVSLAVANPQLQYRMIGSKGAGNRVHWYQESSFYIPVTSQTERPIRVFTGVATYGVLYQPVIIDREERKIRKWPRDWHGENMN